MSSNRVCRTVTHSVVNVRSFSEMVLCNKYCITPRPQQRQSVRNAVQVSVLTFDIHLHFRSFSPQQVGYIRPTSHRQTLRYPFQGHRRLTPQPRRHPHFPFIPFWRIEQIHFLPSYVLNPAGSAGRPGIALELYCPNVHGKR